LAAFGVVLIFDISLFVLHAKHEGWHKDAIREVYQCLAYGIFGLLLIGQHPAYKAMKQLSGNDGWLKFDISTSSIGYDLIVQCDYPSPPHKNTLVHNEKSNCFRSSVSLNGHNFIAASAGSTQHFLSLSLALLMR
jgi:hypothetical protein